MKSLLTSATRQFIMYMVVVVITGILFWLIYLLRDLIGLFLISCFFALLLWPFVFRLKKWKIPDVLGILLAFFGVFLIGALFLASIIPVFVGLAEDSKAYVVRSVTSLEEQAQAGFPLIDRIPFGLGKIVRNEVDIAGFSAFITDENRTQFITNGLIGNIDIIRDFVQK